MYVITQNLKSQIFHDLLRDRLMMLNLSDIVLEKEMTDFVGGDFRHKRNDDIDHSFLGRFYDQFRHAVFVFINPERFNRRDGIKLLVDDEAALCEMIFQKSWWLVGVQEEG